jgi:hypothetical protein
VVGYHYYGNKIDGVAPTRAFYYWKSQNPNRTELSILDSLDTEVLYIKAFDLDWDPAQGVIPYDPRQAMDADSALPNIPWVYTVYITNRALKHIDINDGTTSGIAGLAKKIVDKIRREHRTLSRNRLKIEANKLYQQIRDSIDPDGIKYDQYSNLVYNGLTEYQYISEMQQKRDTLFGIQLDCDWSLSTKDRYFLLLKEVKKLVSVEVSSTLRLWQYKHQKLAGVPPADRVALMLYNMSAREKIETDNSIYDQQVVDQFVNNVTYPLPLDVAIPIFRWGVIFSAGKYKGLLTEAEVMELVEKVEGKTSGYPTNRIKIEKNYTIGGNWLKPGDEVRPEGTTNSILFDAQATARKLIKDKNQRLIYYSLQPNLLERYGYNNILRGFK